VIGSGIAGSTIALSLAAQGVKVLLLEHKKHPRFAIGESTVPSEL
jgi:FADH2 O2-dependent halogenase